MQAQLGLLRRQGAGVSARSKTCVAVRTAAKDADLVKGSENGHQSNKPMYNQLGTKVVHAGERTGRSRTTDAIAFPIVQTATYAFKNTAELIEYNEDRYSSFEYGRYGNPTARAVEQKIAALEGADDCLVSASGMNAVTSMLLSLVPQGGHIITTSDCYWRTRQFMLNFLPKMSITLSIVPPGDIPALQKALDENPTTTLFFSESPTNPYLRCIDIELITGMCHKTGAFVCIDSTFATPINQRAIALGADLSLHSGTKYMAGHNDVLAGVLAGKQELVDKVREFHNIMGGVVDPHAAYLLLRGLKTLELRVERQNRSALEISKRLEKHPEIKQVWYPGLESHPDHVIAKKQMTGFGGVVSFEVKGDLWRCAKFIDNVKLPYIAPSLGGVESLIEMPAVQSYWSFGPAGRAKIGIKESLIRFSIGIEGVEDIWADLAQSLDNLGPL